MRSFVFVIALGTTAALAAEPKFSEFPSTPWDGTRAKSVDLASHPEAPRFRTRLKEGFASGPNFAGRYSVVTWGCGTSCGVLAIVDQKTGKVFFSKVVPFAQWAMWGHEEYGFKYTKDSRLLKVSGHLGESEESGHWYFEWTGEDFRLVEKLLVDPGLGP